MRRPRLNTIRTEQLTQQTPAPLLVTRHGQLPNVPAELARQALPPGETLLLQLPLSDWYILNANAHQLTTDCVPNLGALPAGQTPSAATFTAYTDAILVLTARAAASRETIAEAPGKSLAVRVGAPFGANLAVTPVAAARLHAALRTHFVIAPTDALPYVADRYRPVPAPGVAPTPPGALADDVTPFDSAAVPAAVPPPTAMERRRAKRNNEQVAAFTKAMHDIPASDTSASAAAASLIVSIQGGIHPELRTLCAHAACTPAAGDAAPAGVSIDGLYCGETGAERDGALRAVGDVVEQSCMRRCVRLLTGGSGAPWEVLRAVRHGVDVVDASFPFEMAENGLATRLSRAVSCAVPADAGVRHVNLRDRRWETDKRSVVDGCACFVCADYSRAYLRHLFEVREMMAITLVTAHNLWDYLSWFARLRGAIGNGSFDDFERRTLRRR